VELACRSNMANSLGSGIIATDGSRLLKRPSFFVMSLYANHAKPLALRTKVSTNSLDVLTCSSEDRKSLVVFAVNSAGEPIQCSLSLEPATNSLRILSAEAVADTLDARQPDVVNHWSAPDRVALIPLSLSGNKVMLPALSATAIECGRF